MTVLPSPATLPPGKTQGTIKMKYSESERDLARAHALFEAKPDVIPVDASVGSPPRPRRRIIRAPAVGQEAPQEAAPQATSPELVLATRAVLRELGVVRRPRRGPEPEPRPDQGQEQQEPSAAIPAVLRGAQPLRAYLVHVVLEAEGDAGVDQAEETEVIVLRGDDAAETLIGAVAKINAHMVQSHPGRGWRMESIVEMDEVLA